VYCKRRTLEWFTTDGVIWNKMSCTGKWKGGSNDLSIMAE